MTEKKKDNKTAPLSIEERLDEIERAIVNLDKDYSQVIADAFNEISKITQRFTKINRSHIKYDAKLRRLEQKDTHFWKGYVCILMAVWLILMLWTFI